MRTDIAESKPRRERQIETDRQSEREKLAVLEITTALRSQRVIKGKDETITGGRNGEN